MPDNPDVPSQSLQSMSESKIGDKCFRLTCTDYNQVNIFGVHCFAERVTVILDRSVEERYKMVYR